MKKKLMDLMPEIPFEGEPKAVTREPNDIGESTPVNSGTREDVTVLRCSEPLRYKVGGPKRSTPGYAGWGRLG